MTAVEAASADKTRSIAIVLAALVLGVSIRAWLVLQPPAPAMMWDHHEYVCWSAKIAREGLLSLYDGVPPKLDTWHPVAQARATTRDEQRRTCNYPPMAGYVFAVEGWGLKAFGGEFISNTRAARVVFAMPSFVADLLLAWGAWSLIRLGTSRTVAAVGMAAVFCAPPIIIDSAMWGQTDSWVLAPTVWMVRLMMGQKWLRAGVLWGIALGLKTQAILFTPIWLFALVIHKERMRVSAGMLLAAVLLLALGAPFVPASQWSWFERAYAQNLFEAYKLTTLKAFNLWYVDLLLCENDDASTRLAGLQKDTWGKILLGFAAIVCTYWIIRDRSDSRANRLLRFSAAVLLCAVIFPTRVHERYILLPIPFLICAAPFRRHLSWAVGTLILAAMFQLTSLNWMTFGAQRWAYEIRDVYQEYENLRGSLPPDQFAQLPPPDELLSRKRPEYVQARRDCGDPVREWSLALVEIGSSLVCLVLLCRVERGQSRKAGSLGLALDRRDYDLLI